MIPIIGTKRNVEIGVDYRKLFLIESAIMHDYKRYGEQGVKERYCEDLIKSKELLECTNDIEYNFMLVILSYIINDFKPNIKRLNKYVISNGKYHCWSYKKFKGCVFLLINYLSSNRYLRKYGYLFFDVLEVI